MAKVLVKSTYFQETGYVPHTAQMAIHMDRHRHRVLKNGRRWGKTLLGAKEAECMAFVKNVIGNGNFGWIVGPQFSDCEKEFRIIYDTFKKLGIDKISSKFVNNSDNGSMAIKTRWGFDLECRSAHHPETLTGEGLDFVLMVEAGKHKRKTWTEFVRPTLSDHRGWSMHTGVPEGSSHTSLLYHLYQKGQSPFVMRPDPEKPEHMIRRQNPWNSWSMPSWTNTVIFPGGRYDPEILDAEADLTEEEFARQYGAQFVEKTGRVMTDWDDDFHLSDLEYNPDWPLYLAIDYGFTNPFVILWIQVDAFNNVYVLREDRWKQKDTPDVAREVLRSPVTRSLLSHAVAFYPDPAEPDDTETLKREWRLPARTNTGGELKERLKLIWKALKVGPEHAPIQEQRAGLIIDRHNCKELVWEMREGYRWPEHKSEVKNEDENPMSKDDHGPEALGRFFKGYFGIVGGQKRTRQRKAKVG